MRLLITSLTCLVALACQGSLAQETKMPSRAAPATAPLELLVLGSGGPGATGRAGASYVVLVDGVARIIVDAGPGSFVRLGEANVSIASTDVVLLTHLHIDHAGELPGLVIARAVSSGGPIHFDIFGPTGHVGHADEASFPATSRFVDLLFGKNGAFSYEPDFSAPTTFKTTDIPATPTATSQPRQIYSEHGIVISAIAGHHRDAPAIIYRIDYSGKSITFSGDIDAQGLPDLAKIAKGSDLLVFNTVVLDPPASPEVLYTLHTPPLAIGELAGQDGVGKLLLSHLSPATDSHRSEVSASIAKHFSGKTIYAEDGMRLIP